MDTAGDWLRRVLKVIDENPTPRRTSMRPLRRVADVLSSVTEMDTMTDLGVPEIPRPVNKRGYEAIVALRQRQIFFHIMQQCAARQVIGFYPFDSSRSYSLT